MDAKGRESEPVCIDDEIPFEIPESWAWARMESAYKFIDYRGKTPTKSDSGVRLMTASNIRQGFIDYTREEYISVDEYEARQSRGITQKGDILFTTEAPMGFCALNETNVCSCGQRVITFQNYYPDALHNALFCQFILSPAFQAQISKQATGTTAKGIKAAKLKDLLLPVPPRAEQKRIEEQIRLITPLINQYGALESARERLDAELPGKLRKSILQMAVQGKLVPQDPTDEPASILLERIRAERARLIKEKKVRAPKGSESVIWRASDDGHYEKRVDARGRESEPVCIDDEIPFEIPESWEWARLESVTTYIQRGKSPKYSLIRKYPVVAQKCNQWSGFSLNRAKFIDPFTVSSYADERILQDGDLLWNSTGLGTLGRMAIYDSSANEYGWAVADSHVTVIRTLPGWLDYRYAFAYFAGPSVQSVIEDQASGSTKQKELAQDTVRNYLIPIPPRREQTRIAEELGEVLPRITNQ